MEHLLARLPPFCHFDDGIQMSRRTTQTPYDFSLLLGLHKSPQRKTRDFDDEE
jgi:hypothetical protein